jgi:quercetin dioxygenase-like cupin family protein
VSRLYLSQAAEHQQLEWLDGGTLTMLLDSAATDGQLMMGRFAVGRGEAPPYHLHRAEDEIFLLLGGSALVWCDDEEYELGEGGVVFLPRGVGHAYRVTSEHADILMINTPGGIEGMFRATGRDRSTPRPDGFEVRPDPTVAERYGNVVLGPPR